MEGSTLYHSTHRERTKHALFPHRIAERVQHRALFYRTQNVQYLPTKPLSPPSLSSHTSLS